MIIRVQEAPDRFLALPCFLDGALDHRARLDERTFLGYTYSATAQ